MDRAPDFGLDVITRCGSLDKVSILHSLGTGVALFDYDGDGDLDIFVAAGSEVRDGEVRCAGGPWLFRNDGPGRWTDVTASSGLHYTGWAQAVAVADYDGDGHLDLFVAQHGQDTLWKNQGDGTFRDVTDEAGIHSTYWGVAATWGDYDGDGWPDLYVANYVEVDPIHHPPLDYSIPGHPVYRGPAALPGQPDQLWRNRGDGTFEEVTHAAGVFRPDGKGMGALFVDLNDNGLLDLYVTNDIQANFLFRNLGDGRFHEEALDAGVAVNNFGQAEASMGIDVADVDGDGRLDFAFSNFRREGTRVYRNLGSQVYQDISYQNGVYAETTPFVGWGIVLADFDDDGWPDLFQANGHVYPISQDYAQPPLFLRNRGRGRFDRVTETWGPNLDALRSGRSVAVGDLDGDGDLDVVMTTIDGPLRVLINEGSRTHHAVNLRLIGKHPNLEALGARVELRAGGRTQIGVVRRGGSFLAASDIALHFGLGTADTIEELRIYWPDGTTSLYHNLPARPHMTIRQDDPSRPGPEILPGGRQPPEAGDRLPPGR